MVAVEEYEDVSYEVAEIVEETITDETCGCSELKHKHK